METLGQYLSMSGRGGWPFYSFVRDMEASIEPAAVQFFYANQEGSEEAEMKAAAQRFLDNAHKAREADLAPKAVGAAGLGPAWAGGKPPKHDEL